MIDLRPFASLGHADHGWLRARHHFSFAGYRDAARMGWGRLRVWNDDEIAPGTGFDPHGHRDMEIVTFVRAGAITHRDNLGNEGRTEAGDVQIMSAGTGIVHAEYNLETVETRIFQIWILPDRPGGAPRWGSRRFPREGRAAGFEILASGRAADSGSGALPIDADAAVLAVTLAPGQTLRHVLLPGRIAYLVPASGSVRVNGTVAATRDGLAIRDETSLEIVAQDAAELVMVEAAA
jgi:hypothetical protein